MRDTFKIGPRMEEKYRIKYEDLVGQIRSIREKLENNTTPMYSDRFKSRLVELCAKKKKLENKLKPYTEELWWFDIREEE